MGHRCLQHQPFRLLIQKLCNFLHFQVILWNLDLHLVTMNTPLQRLKSCIASEKVWQQWLPNLPQHLLQDAFLACKPNINNEWKEKVKIQNLKKAKNLGVMIEEKFKLKVKTILNLSYKSPCQPCVVGFGF